MFKSQKGSHLQRSSLVPDYFASKEFPLKILILKPSSLGDVIQALPVLRLLKAHNRNHRIYWWISSDLAGLLENDPDLSGLFLFHRKRWASPKHWGELVRSIREMRAERFDCILDLQGLARSSLIGWLARPKITIGVEDWREAAPAFYDVTIPRPTSRPHAVEWYLSTLDCFNVPIRKDFCWLPTNPSIAAQVRRKWPIQDWSWICVIPGARWLNKRWPIEYFQEVLAKLVRKDPNIRIVVLGGSSDSDLGRAIVQTEPQRCLDLTGQTTFLEVIEWLRLSRMALTNDTGPMHIAAALGKPVVALFGPTDPRQTGPYHQLQNSITIPLQCAPCLSPTCRFEKPMECLRRISPELVLDRIQTVLNLA